MERKKQIASIVIMILCVAAVTVLFIVRPVYSADSTLQRLISDMVNRSILLLAVVVLAFAYGYFGLFSPRKASPRGYLWSIPCLFVALANFPFSALISGSAALDRPELLWLYALEIIAISLLEELVFRLILFDFLLNRLSKIKHGTILAIVLDAAIFGLYHLVNLLEGAPVGSTFLQVGYCFLIGGMFAIATLRTKNLLVPIFLHAVFDFGGFFITILGHGDFQDLVFWILTASMGALALGHCLVTLFHLDKEREFELASRGS